MPSPALQLGVGMQTLSTLGFSREQVSAAILRCPEVVQYK